VKLRDLNEYLRRERGELIAGWGEAELIRYLDGRYELRGGTPEDRQAAREWISMFFHEAGNEAGLQFQLAQPRLRNNLAP
jgi:hypothetical protein